MVIFGASLAFLASLLALFACNFGRLSRQDPSREAFFMKFELPRPLPRGTPSLFQASCKPLPSLQAPSLQAPSLQWPRRVTRSANNPPAHPKDERRRVRSGPPVILPKIPPCWGTRLPPRQSPSPLFFRLFFSPQIFLPKSSPRPFQGTSQGPQNHPKSDFFPNKSSPGPSSCPFFGGSLFFSLFSSIFGHFFMKN